MTRKQFNLRLSEEERADWEKLRSLLEQRHGRETTLADAWRYAVKDSLSRLNKKEEGG